MAELLTAAQMRAIEQAAIDAGEVTGLELMERAGRGVVEAVFEEWPELAQGSFRAVVLCGPGNNGGDGFVVARLLREWGWEVEVFLYGEPGKLPPDARVNYERWVELRSCRAIGEFALADFSPMASADAGPALIVDALFGTGLSRPMDGALTETLRDLTEASLGERPAICAVDIPSGICSDSGRVLGMALTADLTVTFHSDKRGHHLGVGPAHAGCLKTVSIGLPDAPQDPLHAVAVLEGGEDRIGAWVFCDKGQTVSGQNAGHKYAHGHALILSGGAGRTGAARMAARGALRIGAGLVTLGVPGSAQMEVAGHVTAVMLRRVDGAEALAMVLEDRRFNALCLGPGLGVERARELVPVALESGERAVVLDADALTAFEDAPEALFAMLHEGCVLTPHGGEFARLLPDIAEKLAATPARGPAYSKVDATREAAARCGAVVLFKGADTVIAAPDGQCSVNSASYGRAAPWLATAGAGDVLAGFITGLLARGFAPMRAAETGAWLHVECARSFGPGLIAEDLPEELPKVFRALGL